MYTKQQTENMLYILNERIKEYGLNDYRKGEQQMLLIILERY